MIGLLLLMVLPWKVTKAANDSSSVLQTEATGKIIDSHQSSYNSSTNAIQLKYSKPRHFIPTALFPNS